jgi:hypothetical protein
MSIQPQSETLGTPAVRWLRWRKIGMALFWLGYTIWVGAVLLFGEGRERVRELPVVVQILISPLMLPVLWFALHHYRQPLSNLIRRVRLPAVVKYLGFGLVTCVVLGVNLSISFGLSGTDHYQTGVPGADLHPNPLINTLLYFGPYAGTLLAWFLLRCWFQFGEWHVFWLAGLAGALTEPNKTATTDFIVLQMLLSGEPFDALLSLLALIGAYGVPLASIWVIMPAEELPHGQRRVGCLGLMLLWIIPLIASFVSPIISFALIDLIFGTRFLD